MTAIPPDKEALIGSFRAAAHHQVDQWVDQQAEMLTAQEIPTLRHMSDQFMQTGTTLLGGCLQEMATRLSASVGGRIWPRARTAPNPSSDTASIAKTKSMESDRRRDYKSR